MGFPFEMRLQIRASSVIGAFFHSSPPLIILPYVGTNGSTPYLTKVARVSLF